MSLVAGQILDGKYRILRVLGIGGMGAVYEGENTRIHRKVAIKVLHASVASNADIIQRFEREAQAAGRIGSEHIVEVLDLGNLASGERYMVMEFLDGEALTQRIKVRGRVAPGELAPLLMQLLSGLQAAHQAGIVHRDLKPDNVYLVRRHGQDFVKLLDFGVSKFTSMTEELSMTKTGAVMGTPYYMSPEQARGMTVDHRSDLYSIGVVAYQALSGRVPFNAETFNELIFKIALETPEPVERVVPGIDAGFASIIRVAMERDPSHRFQSAADFCRALEAWRATAPDAHGTPQASPGYTGGVPAHPQNARFSQSGSPLGQSGSGLNVLRQSGVGPAQPQFQSGQFQPGQSGSLGHQSNPFGQAPLLSHPGASPPPNGQNGQYQSGQYPQHQGPGPHGHAQQQPLQILGVSGAGVAQPGRVPGMGESQVALAVTTGQPKGSAPILIALGLVALLGVGGGYFFYRSTKEPSPAKPTQQDPPPRDETTAQSRTDATATASATAAVSTDATSTPAVSAVVASATEAPSATSSTTPTTGPTGRVVPVKTVPVKTAEPKPTVQQPPPPGGRPIDGTL